MGHFAKRHLRFFFQNPFPHLKFSWMTAVLPSLIILMSCVIRVRRSVVDAVLTSCSTEMISRIADSSSEKEMKIGLSDYVNLIHYFCVKDNKIHAEIVVN